jgi:hypothetical protein
MVCLCAGVSVRANRVGERTARRAHRQIMERFGPWVKRQFQEVPWPLSSPRNGANNRDILRPTWIARKLNPGNSFSVIWL